jgi:hypothetical protein
MLGEYKLVPFLGINTELLNDQSPDGLCEDVVNLKPKGREEQPYWVPFERLNPLSNNSGTAFSYTHGTGSIKGAFWQIRNFVGENSDTGNQALKRLILLCNKSDRKAIDIIDPQNWEIIKTLELSLQGEYTFNCTRISEITVINLLKDGIPYKLYYLIDDKFIPQGWPELPTVEISDFNKTFQEQQILSGQTAGVQKNNFDQYYLIRYAYKTFDGVFVKHSSPILIHVPIGSENDYFINKFELKGFQQNGIEPFWKSLISGVSVFVSMPRLDKKEALDDGIYYEISSWPFIDRINENQWTTQTNPNITEIKFDSSVWPTLRTLNIDNFTHHSFSANIVDTYNSRLLLGGPSLDFTLPDKIAKGINSSVPNANISQILNENASDPLNTEVEQFYNLDFSEADQSDYDYKIVNRETYATFSPLSGREFKNVEIIESTFIPEEDRVPAPIGITLPIVQVNASINNNENTLFLRINTVSSPEYGGLVANTFIRVKVEIGNIGGEVDQISFFTIEPLSHITTGGPFNFIDVSSQALSEFTEYEVFHEVTIKTDSGEFKRISVQSVSLTGNGITFPNIISYPDRRAVKYRAIVKNGTNYEVAIDVNLIQHPSSNYSYFFQTDTSYTFGGTFNFSTTPPDISENSISSFLRNRVQASLPNLPFVFDAATSYRIGSRENDTVLGFAVNSIDISSGQFGQYPLYILSDKSIWALEQSGDPTIAFARIVPIDTFNGIDNSEALCNAERLIIAADQNYIYSLAGQNLQRIDRAISHHPDYKGFLKGIKLAYHKSDDYEEIICSNPIYDYSWHYNIRYGVWYRGLSSYRYFFQDQPNISGITKGNIIHDFKDKDVNINTSWTLKTRPFNFGNKYVLKKFWKSQIRSRIEHVFNESGSYPQIRVKLWGWKEAQESPFLIMDYTMNNKKIIKDLWLMTKFGAFNAFSIEITGSGQHNGTFLHQIEANFETRYQTRVRR